jgi:hypothetical protein
MHITLGGDLMPNQVKASEKPTVRTTVSIPREDYVDLEGISERQKVSVAWVVRRAIEEYLDRQSPPLRRGK